MTLQVEDCRALQGNAVDVLRIRRVNRVVLSGSNAQLTTRPAMMMVVGKKRVRIVAFEVVKLNPVETPTCEPNSRHSKSTGNQASLVTVADHRRTHSLKVGVPFSCQDPSCGTLFVCLETTDVSWFLSDGCVPHKFDAVGRHR
jgi:hypothetical protein